jgi:hypothetical protein
MTREPDLAFETLAEVTNTDWNAGRGELNKALASIREQSLLEGDFLVHKIRRNAMKYRALFGDEITLSPSALAKHWKRVEAETERPRGTNQFTTRDECTTCDGDRFVLVATRKPVQTEWMRLHEIEASETHTLEEWAPCPDCNAVVHESRRFDGTKIATPDAARTREMLRR